MPFKSAELGRRNKFEDIDGSGFEGVDLEYWELQPLFVDKEGRDNELRYLLLEGV